jgi:UDP-N-acetyl-D-galactosamine dehydrogenase
MVMGEKIAVIGLGYVGLPVAVALSEKFDGVVGFDINQTRIQELNTGLDRTGEIEPARLEKSGVSVTSDISSIRDCSMYIVTVPTPIDENKQPDLTPVRKATETVGSVLKPGDCVVYESTVYPGVTEEYCAPILEKVSGLSRSQFKLGYSPERINPGDKLHRLETITKIVSGEDAATLERVANVYGTIIEAGIYRAESIKVAEAAKVIENTQRDLNIALMNELSLIFDRMGIRTKDVLQAAGTKWNFLPFSPGLVGGHCIGVDPYYLTAKAESLGYRPEVILSGRRVNDSMGAYIAQKTIKLINSQGKSGSNARVGVFGLTFKENVPDLRNSRVPDIISELQDFGAEVLVHDPLANSEEAHHEYKVTLCNEQSLKSLDAIILAVPHREYVDSNVEHFTNRFAQNGVFIDVKSVFHSNQFDSSITYWSL